MLIEETFRKYNKQIISSILVVCWGLLSSVLICEFDARIQIWLPVGLLVVGLLLWRPEQYELVFEGLRQLNSDCKKEILL